jgi:hypothetical protein
LDTSVDRAGFVRQLYNLRHVLVRKEEIEDTGAKILQLQKKIEKHKGHPMKTFNTKDTPGTNNPQGNKRRRGDDAGATDCAELGPRGYEVEAEL